METTLLREGARLTKLAFNAARFALPLVCRTAAHGRLDPHATGRTLRRFIEAMGITFIKLGQYLAIRRDLLGDTICAELSELFSNVNPMAPEQVERVLVRELGRKWRAAFLQFDWQPMAAASIAQVHRAETRDGCSVAVKIQRPEVPAVLAADLRLLTRLANAADALGLLGTISARHVVNEMAGFTQRELDFELEGRTAARLRADELPGIVIPRVWFELTTTRVLTMEFIEGQTLLEICQSAESGDPDAFTTLLGSVDASEAVHRLANACFHQIFVTGRFHGDPHPANVIIQKDGAVAFVDFGVFSEFDSAMRHDFSAYVRHVALGEVDDAFWCLAGLVRPGRQTNLRAYRRDAIDIMERWYASSTVQSASVSDKLVARYQGEMFDTMRRNHIEMPSNQLLFWRALAQVDSIAHRLPIEFDLLDAMRTFFAGRQPDPQSELTAVAVDMMETAATAVAAGTPEQLSHRSVDGDHAPLRLSYDEASPLSRGRNAETEWVAIALVIISLLLPLAIVAAPGEGPSGIMATGAAALIIAISFGARVAS